MFVQIFVRTFYVTVCSYYNKAMDQSNFDRIISYHHTFYIEMCTYHRSLHTVHQERQPLSSGDPFLLHQMTDCKTSPLQEYKNAADNSMADDRCVINDGNQ